MSEHANYETAIQFAGGMPELLEELVELFRDEGPSLLTQCQEAHQAGDAEVLRRHSHTLKSNFATLGAEIGRALCETIEHASADGNLELAGEILKQVPVSLDATLAAVNDWDFGG